jgi:hypothetical protein
MNKQMNPTNSSIKSAKFESEGKEYLGKRALEMRIEDDLEIQKLQEAISGFES